MSLRFSNPPSNEARARMKKMECMPRMSLAIPRMGFEIEPKPKPASIRNPKDKPL